MKFLIITLLFLAGCAKSNPTTTCSMNYSCYSSNIGGFNLLCVAQYGTGTRSGSFTDQDSGTAGNECEAWEFAFINSYGSTSYPYAHPSVTQCTCSSN